MLYSESAAKNAPTNMKVTDINIAFQIYFSLTHSNLQQKPWLVEDTAKYRLPCAAKMVKMISRRAANEELRYGP